MRILWLKTELLHPIDKGGKIRTYHILRELKKQHHITYLTFDDGRNAEESYARTVEYCDDLVCVPHCTRPKFSPGFYRELLLNLVKPLPYSIDKYRSHEMSQKLTELTRDRGLDVLVCDFLVSSVNVPANVPCLTVLFQHNVEEVIWRRHYEAQSSVLKKVYLYDQWRKTRAYEQETCRRFDHIIAVSREDRELMQKEFKVKAIDDVPTGVDTEFFHPLGTEGFEPHNLVFTGSMDWLPNEDAIRYFTEQILPRIKQAIPDVTLTVVGRDPYPSLTELSKRDASIIVTGRVEDVRPYIERAAAYVVPLRIGGGTRLKIYEAMAMEKAVVSTSIGAEGLPLRDGVELLMADDPSEFAHAVVRVLRDQRLARSLGARAAATVRERFGWDKVAESFAAICQTATGRETYDISAVSVNEDAQTAV